MYVYIKIPIKRDTYIFCRGGNTGQVVRADPQSATKKRRYAHYFGSPTYLGPPCITSITRPGKAGSLLAHIKIKRFFFSTPHQISSCTPSISKSNFESQNSCFRFLKIK